MTSSAPNHQRFISVQETSDALHLPRRHIQQLIGFEETTALESNRQALRLADQRVYRLWNGLD